MLLEAAARSLQPDLTCLFLMLSTVRLATACVFFRVLIFSKRRASSLTLVKLWLVLAAFNYSLLNA